MVQFNENSFSVTIDTDANPVEEWLGLQQEIIEVVSLINTSETPMPYRLMGLLRNMQPDYDVALKMTT